MPQLHAQYDRLTDRHIYIAGDCATEPRQWVVVAMAALDQAGLTVAEQAAIERQLLEIIEMKENFSSHPG